MSLGDKVGVIGSRGFNDNELLCSVLDEHQISCIVSGGAEGADTLAGLYASERRIKTEIYKPHWNMYGKRAAAVRNRQIVEASDYIIAFWDGKSPGTKMTIGMAQKVGKNVIVIDV